MTPEETLRKAPELRPPLDVAAIRKDFPILGERMRGHPLVYLDNASTSQKPRVTIEAVHRFYSESYANVHRGIYELSDRATRLYEGSRLIAQRFLGARDNREIVFVRSTTEAVNLVAATYGRTHVGEGDEILVTGMEHHSNLVPWQLLAKEKRARLRVVPLTDTGEIELDQFERLLGARTRIVSVVHVSNALGTVNPLKELIGIAHREGVPVFVDGAQAAPRQPVNVRDLDCDFYAFSGHKAYGPMGVGVLYGKGELLAAMPPYQGGGEMIRTVTFENTTFAEPPARFEAGTPNVAGAVGLGAALEYLEAIGRERIAVHESDLLQEAVAALSAIEGLRLIGTPRDRSGVVSFVLDDIHSHDIGTVLDNQGIAIRAGHHCAQPVMDRFGVPATARVSFGIYNTREELELLVAGLKKAKEVFA